MKGLAPLDDGRSEKDMKTLVCPLQSLRRVRRRSPTARRATLSAKRHCDEFLWPAILLARAVAPSRAMTESIQLRADVGHFGAAALVEPGYRILDEDDPVVALTGLVDGRAWAVWVVASGDHHGVDINPAEMDIENSAEEGAPSGLAEDDLAVA